MEGKGCIVCCVLMLLVLCANNAQAQLPHESVAPNPIANANSAHGTPKIADIRARRGVLGSAAKGAAVGAVAAAAYHAIKKG